MLINDITRTFLDPIIYSDSIYDNDIMYTLVILIVFIMNVLAYFRFPQRLQKSRHFISLSNFATTTSDMEELVYKNLMNNCHVDKNSCLVRLFILILFNLLSCVILYYVQ